MTHTLSIRSRASMQKLGLALGELLKPGDFIGLIGDLGAGKTFLSRAVAEGAGVDASQVASPTFAIVYPYKGRLPLFHADLYRVGDVDELYATGFFDMVNGEGALLVEWVDRIPEALPPNHLLLRLERTGDTSRTVVLEPHGARPAELAEALVKRMKRRR